MGESKNNQENKNIFVGMEEEVLKFWQENEIFEKSVSKDAPKGEYVFYDGPPFITGLPHYGSLLPSVAKDVIPRFWTMNGYRVGRVWGWDCHGLPAENKVEKELSLKNKKDIESLGIGKFIEACRDYVRTGSEQWQWYIDHIGRWVDMKHAYRTMDLNFMESVIWAFSELHKKGFIYEGHRTSLHCPRCATPLSKFEITMDASSYKDVTEKSIVVKFKVKDKNNTYLLAWTTTPWTLPGNLALAVGQDVDYVQLRVGNEEYILAKERVAEILKDVKEFKIVEEFNGKKLLGWKYEPLFDLKNEKISANDKAYKVYAGKFVTTADGTGIVHIAPNFGEDDFALGKENGLPLVDLMDENGAYAKEAGEFASVYYKKAGEAVLERLGQRLFSAFDVTHSYPFCYRCGTPLIYRAQKAWYLNIEKIRRQLIVANEKINWVPEFFKDGRFKYNLENAPDWCLSRSRYWGSPIPVWKCACGEMKVAGSLAEIEKLSGQKIEDLHKPGIDEVEFKCDKCGGQMKRVSEVLDCWFESGTMPFAQFHYPFEKKAEFEKNFLPADFIIEYTGQLRGWFYYLHVLSNALFNKIAFKNVVVSGVLFGTDGRKMSKLFGNYPDPRATIKKYGADALRYYFMSSPIMLSDDTSLNEKDIQDALRKNQMLLWNVYKFYSMYEKDFDGQESDDSKNILDRWILSRFNQLLQTLTENLKKYNLPEAARPIPLFVDDLSTWYLRRSRDRFKGDDQADGRAALRTIKFILLQLSKALAPIMPFISEQLWQKLSGHNFADPSRSVHLEAWPQFGAVDDNLLEEMAAVRKIVEFGLAKRDEVVIKVRQPLGKLVVKNQKLKLEYFDLIKDELNIKEIVCEEGEGELAVELDTTMTPELIAEGLKRELVRFINAERKNAGLSIGDRIKLSYSTPSENVKNVFKIFGDDLKKDVLASEIAEGEAEGGKEVEANGEKLIIKIEKI